MFDAQPWNSGIVLMTPPPDVQKDPIQPNSSLSVERLSILISSLPTPVQLPPRPAGLPPLSIPITESASQPNSPREMVKSTSYEGLHRPSVEIGFSSSSFIQFPPHLHNSDSTGSSELISTIPPPPTPANLTPPIFGLFNPVPRKDFTGLPPPPQRESLSPLPPPPLSGGISLSPIARCISDEELPRFFKSKADISSSTPIRSPRSTYSDLTYDPSFFRKCGICNREIDDSFYFADGLYYHKQCFKCSNCQKGLAPPVCALMFGNLFCLECSCHPRGAPIKKCPVCDQNLYESDKKCQPRGFDKPIHADCFACYECSSALDTEKVTLIDGKPICENCIPIIEDRLCENCQQPITGNFIKVRGKCYHKEHFVCTQCECLLMGRNYVVHHNLIYCPEHGQRYQEVCRYCKKHIHLFEGCHKEEREAHRIIIWHRKQYHKRCFVCRICNTSINPDTCKSVHGRPHCEECFMLRVEDGDCSQKQRTCGSHHHTPSNAVDRRKRFAAKTQKEFREPVYFQPELKDEISDEEEESYQRRDSYSRRDSESQTSSSWRVPVRIHIKY